MEEKELLDRAKSGDQDAFSQIYRDQLSRVKKTLRKYWQLNEDAVEELAQVTFTKAFLAIGDFRGEAKLSSWLHQIAHREFLMYLRRKNNLSEVSLDNPINEDGNTLDLPDTPDKTIDSWITREHFLRLLPYLNRSRRRVLFLRFLEEKTLEETAGILNLSVGAVKAYQSHGLSDLRVLWESKSMSKSMSKKKRRLRREKLVAAAAREHIGSPPPTQIRSSRNAGASRFNETELGSYYHLSGRDPRAPNQIFTSHGLLAKTPVNLRPPRTVTAPGPVRQYTQEEIVHQNYLFQLKQQGEKTMEQIPSGSPPTIESLISDAHRKVQFYTRQAAESEAEARKWTAVIEQLTSAHDIITGKKSINATAHDEVNGNAPQTRSPRGYWEPVLKQILADGPLPKNELVQKMMTAGTTNGQAYSIIRRCQDKELILESDGKLHWMAPVTEEQPRAAG